MAEQKVTKKEESEDINVFINNLDDDAKEKAFKACLIVRSYLYNKCTGNTVTLDEYLKLLSKEQKYDGIEVDFTLANVKSVINSLQQSPNVESAAIFLKGILDKISKTERIPIRIAKQAILNQFVGVNAMKSLLFTE
jgi:hypothetical protein